MFTINKHEGQTRDSGTAAMLQTAGGEDSMALPAENTMRTAISKRDATYDGRFYYGVVTTGVFCRPSCAARPARPENLRFFASTADALAAGFRPCKRCKPVNPSADLDRLIAIARYIDAHADEALTLAMLADNAGLSVSRLQRTFKAAFGISPKAYQDAQRVRRFKQALKKGNDVTEATYSAGFGSSSRVYGRAANNMGMTPSAYRKGGAGETISYAYRRSALGPLLMAATDKGVCFVQFGDSKAALTEQLANEFPQAVIEKSRAEKSAQLDAWLAQLDAHLGEGQPRPDLPLDLRGTAFQMQVWRYLLSVPEGSVVSYSEVASGIGKPKAVRAAASACAANRVGVLIPCHRVLRGDGGTGGYRWGVERKRTLLDNERSRSARSV